MDSDCTHANSYLTSLPDELYCGDCGALWRAGTTEERSVDSETDRLTEAEFVAYALHFDPKVRRLIAEVRQARAHQCNPVYSEHVGPDANTRGVDYTPEPWQAARTYGTVDHARKRAAADPRLSFTVPASAEFPWPGVNNSVVAEAFLDPMEAA